MVFSDSSNLDRNRKRTKINVIDNRIYFYFFFLIYKLLCSNLRMNPRNNPYTSIFEERENAMNLNLSECFNFSEFLMYHY